MQKFQGALREHFLQNVLPGLENDLTALTNINRARARDLGEKSVKSSIKS